jgi:hypothetical protein
MMKAYRLIASAACGSLFAGKLNSRDTVESRVLLIDRCIAIEKAIRLLVTRTAPYPEDSVE